MAVYQSAALTHLTHAVLHLSLPSLSFLCLIPLSCRVNEDDGSLHLLHELHPMEFIDSPEFIGRQTERGAVFHVAIKALDPTPSFSPPTSSHSSASLSLQASSSSLPTPSDTACQVLVFPYTALMATFSASPHIQSTIDALVSRDVTHKLFATGEAMRVLNKMTQSKRRLMEGLVAQRGNQDEEKVGPHVQEVWEAASVVLTQESDAAQ